MRDTTAPAATRATCSTCSADLAFLRRRRRLSYSSWTNPVRIVDLFAGGGGLTLGAAEAARPVGRGVSVALAVENDSEAADIYERKFAGAHVGLGAVASYTTGGKGLVGTGNITRIRL